MTERSHTNSVRTHTAGRGALRGVPAHEHTDEEEQLQTQLEEVQRQVLELQESKGQDERAILGWEWLARLAEENPDPVLRVSEAGVVQYRNRAAVPLCRQWNPNDDLIVPPAVAKLVSEASVSAEVGRHEMTFGKRTYLLTLAPTPPAEYVNIYARDITARKLLEGELRELNDTLEKKVALRTQELEHHARELEHRAGQLQKLTLEVTQAEERERKRMAEVLHDDLQQIIAAAKFHLSMMRNRVKQDASAQTLGAQIDDMLTEAIGKSRSLSQELSPAVLHHGDFTETLDWLARQMQTQHGLVVHVHAGGKVDLQSDALATLLYRAAQELLFNVVKHARVNEASLRIRRRGPYLGLAVSDRGRGFDPQGLREAPGYGLLSIRERIELLGGRMKIKSKAGRGSTFFIAVPDTERAAGSRTSVAGEQKRPADHGPAATDYQPPLRVLLADDHRIVRESLRLLLRDESDVEIVGEAAHGREAVDLALRLQPDVVIMDVAMPLIDGDVATRQIKEQLPHTRVIALSTYNEPEKIERMYQAGAEGYVLKTASPQELLAVIRKQAHPGVAPTDENQGDATGISRALPSPPQ